MFFPPTATSKVGYNNIPQIQEYFLEIYLKIIIFLT